MKTIKRVTAALMSAAVIFTSLVFSVSASAFENFQISSGSYIKCFTISTGNNTPAYGDTSFSSKIGTIYGTDELYVYTLTSSYAKLSYPVKNGRKTAYIPTSVITSNNATWKASTAAAKVTTYKRAGSGTYGYISSGDEVYTVAESNGYVQLIYPISNGLKMGWVTSGDFNNYISAGLKNPSGLVSPVKAGSYFNKKTSDNGWTGYHDINVNVSKGDSVYAIADGTVTFKQAYTTINGVKKLTSYGNFIEFKSSDGVYTAKYCHLNGFNGVDVKITNDKTKVQSGSQGTYNLGSKDVKAGDLIGYIGTTGNSSGVHLHFEMRKNGSRVDPTAYIGGLTR